MLHFCAFVSWLMPKTQLSTQSSLPLVGVPLNPVLFCPKGLSPVTPKFYLPGIPDWDFAQLAF